MLSENPAEASEWASKFTIVIIGVGGIKENCSSDLTENIQTSYRATVPLQQLQKGTSAFKKVQK